MMWEYRKGNMSGYGEVWDVFDPHGAWVACFDLESEAKEYIEIKSKPWRYPIKS